MIMIRLEKPGVVVTVSEQDADTYKRGCFVEVKDAKETEGAPEGTKALPDMTLAELREEAKARGLSGYSALAKDDLLALLTGEQKQEEEGE
jgi:hypothetical protein